MDWIDVHTQLPGVGKPCLFVVRGKVRSGVIGPSDNGFRIYDGSEFDDAPLIVEVTHWMPLPSPPTPESEELGTKNDITGAPYQQDSVVCKCGRTIHIYPIDGITLRYSARS